MKTHIELASRFPWVEKRAQVDLEKKMAQSAAILKPYCSPDSENVLTEENFRAGTIPRISPYDEAYLPQGSKLIEVPKELRDQLLAERSYDLTRWNRPSAFLTRLKISQEPFKQPTPGGSRVMDRLVSEGKVVAFDNLRLISPAPENERQSRKDIDAKMEINIMGQARIPFALGSVPDVGSFLSYVTVAQANGMVFISRDKLLSDIDQQAILAGDVIGFLRNVKLPTEINNPTDDELKQFSEIIGLKEGLSMQTLLKKYRSALRESWVANVGAAIEATPKGIERAEALYDRGCKLFRIYSPEGGTEIIDTIKGLKKAFGEDIKIVAGQIMDINTAIKAEDAGADSLFIGVAGGSQCTTSVNADIAVNAPNLLYELRGNIKIPVGIEGGGVGTHLMTAFALGASFVSKPGEIGVSFEGAGGKYMFEDPNGNLLMIYGGEASVSAKWWKDSIDDVGRPKFVEGETGVRKINKNIFESDKRNISQTGNINRLRNMLSIGLVFQRTEKISDLHKRTCDNIVEVTTEASEKSQAYAK